MGAEDDACGVWDGEGAAEGARGRRLEASGMVTCAAPPAERAGARACASHSRQPQGACALLPVRAGIPRFAQAGSPAVGVWTRKALSCMLPTVFRVQPPHLTVRPEIYN